jgi:hypothetical protein
MLLFQQRIQDRKTSFMSFGRPSRRPSWDLILSGVRLLLEVLLLCCQVVEYLAIL